MRVPEPLETLARGVGERGVALDRDHLAHELREHRRLIARAGADLEDAMLGARREELGHAGDDVRLRDRLPLADRQRVIAVGDVAVIGRDELLPRDARHRLHDALVADAEALENTQHLAPLLCRVHRHMMQRKCASPFRSALR